MQQGKDKLGIMPINKLIWNMSLPIIASMLVQALYNVVDSIFVSHVSEQALTAVSLAFSAQQLMIGLATGTAVGMNALMGRALGARQQEKADSIAINGVFLAFASSIVSAIIVLLFGRKFFMLQTAESEIVTMGTQYLTIIVGVSLGSFFQVIFERILQGTGRSFYSMITQGVGALLNIILDPIFIFALDLGVAGAAIATVIGQFSAAVLALYFNLKINTDITLRFRGFRPNWKIIGNIYGIGLPSIIMMAIGSVTTFSINKILITYHSAHETAATVFGAYYKLNSFVFMPIFGLNNGVVPIVSYNYGAQNRERMTETIRLAVIYATCITTAGMCVFMAVPQLLLRLFNASALMLTVGVPALRIIGTMFPICGANIALGTVLQSLGQSVYFTITSFIRQLIVIVPAAYFLAQYGTQIGNDNLVWWAYPIAELIALILTLLFYRTTYRKIIAKIPFQKNI